MHTDEVRSLKRRPKTPEEVRSPCLGAVFGVRRQRPAVATPVMFYLHIKDHRIIGHIRMTSSLNKIMCTRGLTTSKYIDAWRHTIPGVSEP